MVSRVLSPPRPSGGAEDHRCEAIFVHRSLRIFVPHASDLFTNHRPDGDGLVAYEVASRLAARGHHVHVMAPNVDVRGAQPPTLHIEPSVKAGSIGLKARVRYLARIRSTYARLSRQHSFDVIHQLNPVSVGYSLALFDARVPVVLGAYVAAWPKDADSAALMGLAGIPFIAALRGALAAVQQEFAAALILSTPAARTKVAWPSHSEQKIFEIPHGIDPALYDDRDLCSPPADAPVILFLGGIERRKGIYVLLEAFKAVYLAFPKARLLIAGVGHKLGNVAALISTMPERVNIEMLGGVAHRDVPALMRRATVLVAPSYGEPFGMVLLEAMASAKPLVVTDAGGAAHLVDSSGGFKVPVGDPAALADALLAVLRSPEVAEAMGCYNRRKVESAYAWDRIVDRIEGVYAHVLGRPSRR